MAGDPLQQLGDGEHEWGRVGEVGGKFWDGEVVLTTVLGVKGESNSGKLPSGSSWKKGGGGEIVEDD